MLAVQIRWVAAPERGEIRGSTCEKSELAHPATMDDDERPPAQRGLKRAHDADEPIRPIKRLDKKVAFLS